MTSDNGTTFTSCLWKDIQAQINTIVSYTPEVGGTNFWVLESESGIMPMSKRIQYWIRDSEKKLNETESETETKKKP